MTVKVLCYCDLCQSELKFDRSENGVATSSEDFDGRGMMIDIASGDVDAEDFDEGEFSERAMIKHACDKCKSMIREKLMAVIKALRNGKKPTDIFKPDAFDVTAKVAKPKGKGKTGKTVKKPAGDRGGFDPETDASP